MARLGPAEVSAVRSLSCGNWTLKQAALTKLAVALAARALNGNAKPAPHRFADVRDRGIWLAFAQCRSPYRTLAMAFAASASPLAISFSNACRIAASFSASSANASSNMAGAWPIRPG
jgi:hypothetical protein